MKCEEGDAEAQNDQVSDDWFCGEKSPVTDQANKLSFATKVTICIDWSRHSLPPWQKKKGAIQLQVT